MKKKSFEKKLKAYSAVAAGTLLLAPSANAAVQYSGLQNLGVSVGNDVFVDMDGDANEDALIWVNVSTRSATSMGTWINMSLYSATSVIHETVHGDAANLPSNYQIRSTVTQPNYWSSTAWTLLGSCFKTAWCTVSSYGTNTWGNFNGTTGYIGIRFPANCGPAFGWIRFRGLTRSTGTVIDWAYEDTCGPILAGDGAAPAVSVPTLNQWGLFALIALLAGAGVMRLRKQEES